MILLDSVEPTTIAFAAALNLLKALVFCLAYILASLLRYSFDLVFISSNLAFPMSSFSNISINRCLNFGIKGCLFVE